jgi:uncharacterized membrane protein YqjE
MADLQTTHDPGTNRSVTPLLTGIVNDIQDLLKQNLALFKVEVREDMRKTKEAAAALGVGVALAAVGGLHLTLMVVFLLSLIPRIDLWVCFGIVGAVFVGFGLALFLRGKKKLESFNPLPDESAEALKENVQCLTKNI